MMSEGKGVQNMLQKMTFLVSGKNWPIILVQYTHVRTQVLLMDNRENFYRFSEVGVYVLSLQMHAVKILKFAPIHTICLFMRKQA